MMTHPVKVALVLGTRPEAIKLAPLYLCLSRAPEDFTPQLWLTGQHRELLDQALATFGLRAHRDFNLMRPGQTPADVACAVLAGFQAAFAEERPDMIVVQGDTTTAFAAALAGFYARIPVAHLEPLLALPGGSEPPDDFEPGRPPFRAHRKGPGKFAGPGHS